MRRAAFVLSAAALALAGCAEVAPPVSPPIGLPPVADNPPEALPLMPAPGWPPSIMDSAPPVPPRSYSFIPRAQAAPPVPRPVDPPPAPVAPDPPRFAVPRLAPLSPDDGTCWGWWRLCHIIPN